MNTKILMTASSIVLGLAGLTCLFAPQELLAALGLPATNPLPVFIQLLGALYCSFALMDWTAKDSLIGGIYARPTSHANLVHFAIGTLVLAKDQLSNGIHLAVLAILGGYIVFGLLFWWLVFKHSGIVVKKSEQPSS